MPEQPPSFVVVDKRKFTADGEVREGYVASPQSETHPAPPPEEPKAPTPAPPPVEPVPSANVVTMPQRSAPADDLADESLDGSLDPVPAALDADGDGPETESDLHEEDFLDTQTPEQTAAQQTAYRESTQHLDTLLQQANPGMEAPVTAGFEHLVQSFYLSAIMAMGAGTEAGQKPRIDIMGARQAIDLLAVLEEKTRGNLSPDEQQLLQTITFELRMAFLELTNAISRQAHQPPPMPPGAKR